MTRQALAVAILALMKACSLVPDPVAPVAAFDADVTSGTAPLTIEFTDLSVPGTSEITDWLWDFGDGDQSTDQDPTHTYQEPGVYDVSLTVTSAHGTDTVTETELITVTLGPDADFESDITSGDAPLEVTFTDQSVPGDFSITEWAWDFGDGTQSTQQDPVHIYENPGTYDVSLTVTASNGEDTKTEVGLITVSYDGPRTILLPGDVPLVIVWIPEGSFMMGVTVDELDGSPNEMPRHQVTFARGFWMGQDEITKEQWEAVMDTTPWQGQSWVLADPQSPAVYISWDDAKAFVTALNEYTGLTFHLPSEAQWEYAARGGTSTRFFWGDDLTYTDIDTYAWNIHNAWNVNQKYAHIVGLKPANAYGLYDVIGNAWEWCEDDWLGGGGVGYTGAPADGSAWVSNPRYGINMIRGGNFNANVYYNTTTRRMMYNANYKECTTGLRIAK